MKPIEHDKIAVVDFGGQFCHLIATKVRHLEVLAEIKDPGDPVDSFHGYKGIILSGSPSLASAGEGSGYTEEILDIDVPILGFCFGHQEIAKHYGGTVEHCAREYGFAQLHVLVNGDIFHGLGPLEQVWMSHGDSVTSLPPGFIEIGYTTLSKDGVPHRNAAIANPKLRRFGFQFHPEVDDTTHGREMLANFVFRVCGCRPTWRIGDYVRAQVELIKEEVGDRDVFLLASGGVDSTVTARLLEQAIGADRLRLLHIDNGLMRLDESRRVVETFEHYGMGDTLTFVDASDTFLTALKGVTDPERKREIIGNTFIEVFEREAERLGLESSLLGQGTIYPDTIETGGTARADVIKTHHNRVPLVVRMMEAGRVIEPLRDLYKSEVRELGRKLGLSDDLILRHPFPGPGLGIRCLCSDGTAPDGFDPSAAAAVLDPITGPAGLRGLLLPIRSVGVKADLRSYEFPVLLQGGDVAWEQLVTLAGRIGQEVPGVNRCIHRLDRGAPVETAAPEAAAITRERLDLLRRLDHVVMTGLAEHGLMDTIWQCPTVLVPVSLDGRGRELVVVRPIHSEKAMTARPAPLPAALVDTLLDTASSIPEVAGVAIDVTTKPPATIEWE